MIAMSIFDLQRGPEVMQVIVEHLGYPAYFVTMIGVARLLGVVGIWQTKVPALREWAFAGFFFDFIAAIVSHMSVGDAFPMYAAAVISLLLCSFTYWAYRVHAPRPTQS